MKNRAQACCLPKSLTLQIRRDIASGHGQKLPDALRVKMESFFEVDFSEVRIHVGPQASALGAQAFAYGDDIYFAPGYFNPTTQRTQQLLAHELVHVVQQRAGRVHNPLCTGIAIVHDKRLEMEADQLGHMAAMHHNPYPLQTPSRARRAAYGVLSTPTVIQCSSVGSDLLPGKGFISDAKIIVNATKQLRAMMKQAAKKAKQYEKLNKGKASKVADKVVSAIAAIDKAATLFPPAKVFTLPFTKVAKGLNNAKNAHEMFKFLKSSVTTLEPLMLADLVENTALSLISARANCAGSSDGEESNNLLIVITMLEQVYLHLTGEDLDPNKLDWGY